MKRFAGMLAVALATAAQSQTPSPHQAPTPAAAETPSQAPIAPSNSDAPSATEQGAPRDPAAVTTSPSAVTASPSAVTASPSAPTASPSAAAMANVAQSDAVKSNATNANVADGSGAGADGDRANGDRADVVQAATYLKSAAADFTNCRRASACKIYFDSFGVAIPFADGSIVPFSHVQRLSATSRECVKKAKALEEEGNRSLAVQWAMAARIENRTIRDWLGNHPDAVLEALRQVTVL